MTGRIKRKGFFVPKIKKELAEKNGIDVVWLKQTKNNLMKFKVIKEKRMPIDDWILYQCTTLLKYPKSICAISGGGKQLVFLNFKPFPSMSPTRIVNRIY